MSKNAMVPLFLLVRIIELLEGLDVTNYDLDFRCEYSDILWALKYKMKKLELRETYSRFVTAEDEDARHWTRIEYLYQKGQLGKV